MHLESARVLVEPEAVRERVAGALPLRGHRLEGGYAEAVWAKPGRHFNVCYRFEDARSEGRDVLVSCFAVGPKRARRIVAEAGPHRCGDPDSAACVPCASFAAEPGLLFQLFPVDYRLPTLPDCLDPGRAGKAIDNGTPVGACEIAGYRPGMRCQVRYRMNDETVLYGKVAVERAPGHGFRQLERVRAALSPAAAIRLPRPLRYASELQLTLIASVGGESLYDALHRGRTMGGRLAQAAATLAELHRLEIDEVERVYGPADELALVGGWVELVAALFPDMAGGLRAAQADLIATQPSGVDPSAIVHRDFYDKQVLSGAEGPVFLDMDTTCRGDAEIDLGNFCAHFQLRGRQWGRLRELAPLESAFLSGYKHDFCLDRARWYRAATLLRLACVYALRPHWRHVAPELAEEARRPWRP